MPTDNGKEKSSELSGDLKIDGAAQAGASGRSGHEHTHSGLKLIEVVAAFCQIKRSRAQTERYSLTSDDFAKGLSAAGAKPRARSTASIILNFAARWRAARPADGVLDRIIAVASTSSSATLGAVAARQMIVLIGIRAREEMAEVTASPRLAKTALTASISGTLDVCDDRVASGPRSGRITPAYRRLNRTRYQSSITADIILRTRCECWISAFIWSLSSGCVSRSAVISFIFSFIETLRSRS